ncbi:MAG: hypothetical protein GWP59_06790 [Chlamydiales bacterium]|nr:hypothetical protein [Chlamydiales bacterium]NCF71389.1 hypothetical protein [Chlamydiales bacterium]
MVNFTREPIIESIITPKEGCKLVVRNSKGVGQEEYFVDALEIVSFGNALFYRSNEKPKSFLLPVTDYEVLEVRDTRLVLKNISPSPRLSKSDRNIAKKEPSDNTASSLPGNVVEVRQEKRRRRTRRKKDREEGSKKPAEETSSTEEAAPAKEKASNDKPAKQAPKQSSQASTKEEAPETKVSTEELKKMLVPPPILISDTISRYKEYDEEQEKAQKSKKGKGGKKASSEMVVESEEMTLSISNDSDTSAEPFTNEDVASISLSEREQAMALENDPEAKKPAAVTPEKKDDPDTEG